LPLAFADYIPRNLKMVKDSNKIFYCQLKNMIIGRKSKSGKQSSRTSDTDNVSAQFT